LKGKSARQVLKKGERDCGVETTGNRNGGTSYKGEVLLVRAWRKIYCLTAGGTGTTQKNKGGGAAEKGSLDRRGAEKGGQGQEAHPGERKFQTFI